MDNGFLLFDKPRNLTSSDSVLKIKKLLGLSKIGHTGTLDKLAQGLLILPFGKYTCFSELFLKQDKLYKFKVEYGIFTDSGDLDGKVLKQIEKSKIKEIVLKRKAEIENLFMSVVNWNTQIAPKVSALKVNGKRQATLFRKGIDFAPKKRSIQIKSIKIQDSQLSSLSGEIFVSSGTYIRKIIMDVAEKLNLPMVLTFLSREKVGKLNLEQANSMSDIKNGNFKSFSLDELIRLQYITVDEQDEKKVSNGQLLKILEPLGQNFLIKTTSGKLLAWCERLNDIKYKYKKVFV